MSDSAEDTVSAEDGVTGKGKNVNLGSENNDDFTEGAGNSGNQEAGEGTGENAALNTDVEMRTSNQRAGGEDDISGDILPQRLFATDRYPTRGRINSYSKSERILELAELLHGSLEWDWILDSCFAPVFELPVRMSSFSGKLVHQILCRSLVTAKKHELWFVFRGYPIRFSLQEFGIITRLKCGPLPPPVEINTNHFASIVGTGPDNSYTITEIMKMLKRDKRLPEGHENKMDWMRRLRLALIVIVDGILICDTSVVKATRKTAEMVYDLDTFVKHPWGRVSFTRLLEMVKVGPKVDNLGELVEKFKQSHTTTHGFTLALQLFILKAVPKLQNHLPHIYDDDLNFTSISVVSLTLLKTFHNSNILQTEMDPQLVVESILKTDDPSGAQEYLWNDEEDDAGVDVMLTKLKEGYVFKKDIWQGGVSDHPSITSCLSAHKKPKKPAPVKALKAPKSSKAQKVKEMKRIKEKQPNQSKGKQKADEGATSDFGGHATAGEIKELVRALVKEEVQQQHNELLGKMRGSSDVERAVMRDELFDDVLKALKELGVLRKGDGKEVSDDEIREQLKKTSSYNTQGLYHAGMIYEENNTGFGGGGIAEILTSVTSQCKDPKVGEYVYAPEEKQENRAAEFTEGNTEEEDKPAEVSEAKTTEDILPDVVAPFVEGDVRDDVVADDVDAYLVDGSDNVEESGGGQENGGGEDGGGGYEINAETECPGGGNASEEAEYSVNECVKPGAVKKRKDPVAGQELPPLPAKRARVIRYENTYTYKKKKGKAGVCDATKKGAGDVAAAVEKQCGVDGAPAPENQGCVDGAVAAESKGGVDGAVAAHTKAQVDGDIAHTQGEGAGDGYVPVYMPFGIVHPTIKEKFIAQLKAYTGDAYTIEGHAVGRDFFEQLYTPSNWVGTTHMEAMLNTMWKTLGDKFVQARIAVLDTLFTQTICNEYPLFEKTPEEGKAKFGWSKIFKTYVGGKVCNRPASLGWFSDVDTVYVPMHWGKGHWVAVVIKLMEGKILILDPLISKHADRDLPQLMKPLLHMLPIFCRIYPKPSTVDFTVPESFTFERVVDVYQNERSGDCGPLAVKFIELHAQGIELDTLTDAIVDEMRMKFAVNVYEEYVQPLRGEL